MSLSRISLCQSGQTSALIDWREISPAESKAERLKAGFVEIKVFVEIAHRTLAAADCSSRELVKQIHS